MEELKTEDISSSLSNIANDDNDGLKQPQELTDEEKQELLFNQIKAKKFFIIMWICQLI